MKRSEMLALITDIIAEVCYREIAEKRAVRILDMIEEKGMLPPSISTEVGDYYLEDINEWEDEK